MECDQVHIMHCAQLCSALRCLDRERNLPSQGTVKACSPAHLFQLSQQFVRAGQLEGSLCIAGLECQGS